MTAEIEAVYAEDGCHKRVYHHERVVGNADDFGESGYFLDEGKLLLEVTDEPGETVQNDEVEDETDEWNVFMSEWEAS